MSIAPDTGVLAIKIDAPEPGASAPQLQWRLPKAFAPLSAQRPILDQLETRLNIKAGDLVLLVGGDRLHTCHILGKLRTYAAQACQAKGLWRLDSHDYRFLWVVDFPLFVPAETDPASSSAAAAADSSVLEACHHPFTAPVSEDAHLLGPVGQASPSTSTHLTTAAQLPRGLHGTVRICPARRWKGV